VKEAVIRNKIVTSSHRKEVQAAVKEAVIRNTKNKRHSFFGSGRCERSGHPEHVYFFPISSRFRPL
jgi:hypothetical protein